ncbi:MAG: hypothetical protein ACJAXH_001240 [Colwellia sp.]|jgi:hypothetical protein
MIISVFCYVLLAILSIAVPIKLKYENNILLSASSIFMGAAIITAIFHSNVEKARWIIVGLNSIGMMAFYLRYRIIKNKRQ